jgi:catechol 2,3-dioxygenase-like lactoylglutathione lyase family enzyme
MADFQTLRVGTILAVADVERSVRFYTGLLGFGVEATYADPPYATLTLNGVRLSLAEQGHAAPDRPGVRMTALQDRSEAPVVLVLEVADARAVHRALAADGATFLADPYEPPWGGCRFFVVDPDGYLVELEQSA